MKRAISGAALAGILAAAVPAAPALANGAASTRNILFGLGAASYLIIQHNRKVHEKYAQYDRQQAALQAQNNDAWAAYRSAENAYNSELAEVSDLKREVAYQHDIITQQRQQLAFAQSQGYRVTHQVAQARPVHRAPAARHVAVAHTQKHAARKAAGNDVAMVSYGWGQL